MINATSPEKTEKLKAWRKRQQQQEMAITQACWEKIKAWDANKTYRVLGDCGDCGNYAIALHRLLPDSLLIGLYDCNDLEEPQPDQLHHIMVEHMGLLHDIYGMRDYETFWLRWEEENNGSEESAAFFVIDLEPGCTNLGNIRFDEGRIQLYMQLLRR